MRIAAITSALFYVGTVTGALLNAVEKARRSFVAQALYAAAAVVIVMPMTAVGGLYGAFVGSLISAAVLAGISTYYVMKLGNAPALSPTDSFESPGVLQTV
jgi:O-antigen/teichoic acid export membrane protein